MKLIRTKGRGARETAALLASLERRGGAALDKVLPAVRRIVADVRRRGDRALFRYAAQFDGLDHPASLRITREEMVVSLGCDRSRIRQALSTAALANPQVCRAPTSEVVELLYGSWTAAGQVVRPLSSVGCYVPSGRHPLPSTLLMTAIPAQVAGVARIVAVSPKPARETLAAAHLLGITEFYRVGGHTLLRRLPTARRRCRVSTRLSDPEIST